MGLEKAKQFQFVSVEDYLAGEELAKRKHEYAAGRIYAMAGARFSHNQISSRVFIAIASKPKGSPCEIFGSDSKVRVDLTSGSWCYYPDVSVICGDNIIDEVYQTHPTIVVEVLSKSTRRADEGEKRINYLQLESLQMYLMFEQEFPCAIVYRRNGSAFERIVYEGMDAIIPLPDGKTSLSLAEVYTGVNFVREPDPEWEDELQECYE